MIVASPTAAGTYTVTATIADANYQGSLAGSLVIAKAAASVSLSGLGATYDGSIHTSSATTSPAGLGVSVVYTQNGVIVASPTAAGTYAVTASITDPNYQGNVTGSLVIARAAATVSLSNLSATYSGLAHPPVATTSPAGLGVSLVYTQNGVIVTNPTAAGTYVVTATISDPNYQGSTTGTLTIGVASASVSLAGLAASYNGSAQAATATTSPAGLKVNLAYAQNGVAVASPTAAGTYAVTATISDPNYAGSTTATLTIGIATASVSLSGLAATYSGAGHAATATTSPAGLKVNLAYAQNGVAVASPTAAGTYTVTATISDPNFKGGTTGTLTIGVASASVSLAGLAATYNGSAQAATATTSPAGLKVNLAYAQNGVAVASPTAAGTYTVTATISDPNYQGTATGSLVIAKASASVSINNLTATYDGSPHLALAATSAAGLGVNLVYTQNGNVVASPTAAGTYGVTATVTDPNYQGGTTGSFTILQATQTIALNAPASAVFATTFHVNPTSSSGLPVSLTGTNCTIAASPSGGFDVTLTSGSNAAVLTATQAGDANHTAATGAITVQAQKATAGIAISGLQASFDGNAHPASTTTSPAGLAVNLAYEQGGSPVATPVNAGSYTVIATISDPNYQGTATSTLTIAASPAVVLQSVQVVTNRQKAVTSYVLTFSGPLSASAAQNRGNYRLATAGKGNSFDAKNAKVLAIGSISYASTGKTSTVTLTIARPFKPSKPVQLRVNASNSLDDSLGRPLGGGTTNVILPKAGVAALASQARVSTLATRAVNHVLRLISRHRD